MLNVAELEVEYSGIQVLWGVDLEVARGEIVCLLGSNGAGKSTVMNTISGLVKSRSGTIMFDGERIDQLRTHELVARGIAHVLERRRVFAHHTVATNLALGAYLPEARRRRAESLEWVLDFLPALRERLDERAGGLSGGLQQQLAIARGLMSRPKLLMLDEPFIGLSPGIVDDIVHTIGRIRSEGITVLFIEQNVERALQVSDRGYVLQSGHVVTSGPASSLLDDDRLIAAYFGAKAT